MNRAMMMFDRMAFTQKTINREDALGADLRELRERAAVSRVTASRQTKIPISLIRAWEEDVWDATDDASYMERLLRVYVQFLGGNEKFYLHKYRQRLGALCAQRNPQEFLPRPVRLRRWDTLVVSRLVAVVGFGVFVLGLSGYVYGQARAVSLPPVLEVEAPTDGQKVDQPLIEVRGKTLAETSVLINGQAATVQPDGTFSTRIAVPRGTTTVTISAKRRHGREAVETRRVVFER